MKTPETETMDRLYLELSQFTTARTEKELIYADALELIQRVCVSTKHLDQVGDIAKICTQTNDRINSRMIYG